MASKPKKTRCSYPVATVIHFCMFDPLLFGGLCFNEPAEDDDEIPVPRGLLGQSKYAELAFANVPGFTRSKLKPDYAMIAHESRVYGGLFGWENTSGAYVVSPGMNKSDNFNDDGIDEHEG